MEAATNENQNALLTGRKKSTLEASNTWYLNLISFAINYLLYSLFSQYTSDIFYYESLDCVILLKHSQSLANLYYYYAIIGGVCFFTCLFGCDFSGLKTLLQAMVNLIIFVYLFIVTGDLIKGESCGDLRTLVMIWAVYEWVCISCICLACCCMICALGVGVMATSQSNNRRN